MKVLDHGYVELIETWGSDERIIESARMSTQKGFQGWGDDEQPGDEKLLRYLWKNNHDTPFEFAGAVFEVQAPIFVFREWHRHRVFSVNEASARYAPLPDINYVPTLERIMADGGTNRQAQGTKQITREMAEYAVESIKASYAGAQVDYEWMLDVGVPKELARLVLPVGRYSRMRVSANLRNWLGFLRLRQDQKAQYEIRVYADAVCEMLEASFPRTVALYKETT